MRLVVEQVIKTFGQKPAVDNISVEVGGPAMIGAIGRNPVAARAIRDTEAAAS